LEKSRQGNHLYLKSMNIEVVLPQSLQRLFSIFPAIWLLAACGIPGSPVMTPNTLPETTPVTLPTAISPLEGLSGNDVKTLNSLKKVDDHPLYSMHYYGDYITGVSDSVSNRKVPFTDQPVKDPSSSGTNWACSLFAALGNKADMFYGRNFDKADFQELPGSLFNYLIPGNSG
jgi:hypothetical protein